MTSDDSSVVEIRDALLASANPDGGWGYYAGHASRLEPTCWALRALRSAGALSQSAVAGSAQLFQRWQRSDGFLIEPDLAQENRPNVAFNALAAWLLVGSDDLAARTSSAALIAALSRAKGVKLPASTINRQDDSLQGWAWIDGTFSWVEPTCWGLIALKAARPDAPGAAARIAEAERLLIDRSCPSGGWNYGNGNMLGQSLHPYVPTTALGLLAMKPRTGEPCVARALDFLKSQSLSEPSGMALGLAILALRAFGESVADVEHALLAQWRRTQFLGNAHLMGVALYSLG